MKKLLVATRNQGKLNEFVSLLAGLPYKLVSLNTLDITEVVEETGSTFYENALIYFLGNWHRLIYLFLILPT